MALHRLVWIVCTLHICFAEDRELELLEKLFEQSGYNPLIRPVNDSNNRMMVGINIALSQIIHLDQRNQVMKTNVWLQMEWDDPQITWDEKEFGVSTIRITPDKVWTPDVILFNNADGVFEPSYDSNVVINSNGYIYWIPPAIFESSCSIDVEFFPFDQQECEMHFGSWSYSLKKLNFTHYHNVNIADITDYSKSGTWIILEASCYIETMTKQSSQEDYAEFVVRFTLRRMTLFYLVNLIIPCVMISFVSITVFLLPAEACEKITLCISMLLVLVVFLLLISNFLPPTSTIPLVAKYLLFTFIMNSLAIVFTVIIINQSFRTPRTHEMPRWIRLFFLNYLPRMMFMKRPDHDTRWQVPQNDTFDFTSPDLQPVATNRRPAFGDLREAHHPGCKLNKVRISEDGRFEHRIEHSEECRQRLILDIHAGAYQAADAVQFLRHHIEKEEKFEAILDDWRYVATVIDRFFFYLYLLITSLGTIGILMKAPYILDPKDQDEIIAQMTKIIESSK